ncbi:unnamed protein product [Ambrosiozyma monospora]|uniref:Unnamed protein product n=1 Tax=Ambrosiozyma monospora TaxID=43982 RepID=A0ACB5TLM5_AMBMO|nr:unnamed protein product [Ambrosiozyma monospora]
MSVSYSLSPLDAVSLASQLPLDIQLVILKDVVVSYSDSRCPERAAEPFQCREIYHDMLEQLVSMLGYNTLFDKFLSMVIQELNLDESIFSSPHFEQFAKFVITRSLKIKSLQVVPRL